MQWKMQDRPYLLTNCSKAIVVDLIKIEHVEEVLWQFVSISRMGANADRAGHDVWSLTMISTEQTTMPIELPVKLVVPCIMFDRDLVIPTIPSPRIMSVKRTDSFHQVSVFETQDPPLTGYCQDR